MFKAPLSDEELWAAIKQDEIYAFDLLFKRHWSSIYSIAYSYIKDNDASADIVQDTFLNIWQKRNVLNIINLKNYLNASVRYGVYKYLKVKSAGKINLVENYDQLEDLFKDSDGADCRIRDMELATEMDEILEELPKRCREIFVLSRMENLSNAEIADQLGISKRSVENQITIAARHIRLHVKHIAILIIILCFS